MRLLAALVGLVGLAACRGGDAGQTTPSTVAKYDPWDPNRPFGDTGTTGGPSHPGSATYVTEDFKGFAKDTTYYVVEVHAGKASCHRYDIDVERGRMSTTRGATNETIKFRVADRGLWLDETMHTSGKDVLGSRACEMGPYDLSHAFDDGTNAPSADIMVGSARWYATQAGCDEAIRTHQRVAMNFHCELPPLVTSREKLERKARFENILAKGGSLYSVVFNIKGKQCKRIRVVTKKGGFGIEGTLIWETTREDGVKGTSKTTYGVQSKDSKLFLSGPDIVYKDGEHANYGCADEVPFEANADHALLFEKVYYTLEACQGSIKQEAAAAYWFPVEEDLDMGIDDPRYETSPGFGGC